MDYTIPVTPEVLALVAKVLLFTQAVKKLLESSWVKFLLSKLAGIAYVEVSAIAAVALSVVIGVCFGIQQYADGGISVREIIDILSAVFGANGAFALWKAGFATKKE